MSNKFPIQERILKIFTPVRCLSRDQLPRYVEGKMTDVEKHLVEQHLVDCDLCYNALQSLEKQADKVQYEQLTTSTVNYIHQHYLPAPKVQVQQKAIRKGRKQESLLAYFWTLALIGFIGGGIYIVQAAIKHRGTKSHTMNLASAEKPAPATYKTVAQVAGETRTPPVNRPAPQTAPATQAVLPDTLARKALQAVKRDTLAAAPKPVTPKRDSPVTPPATVVKDSVVRTPKPAGVEKAPEPKEEKKEAPKPATPPGTAEKEVPKGSVNIDESLYKSALMLQQQGQYEQAIDRYKKVSGNSKFNELAKYQTAVCYKNRGQSGKAKKLFKEVVKMDGSMKVAAQNALND